MQTKFTSPIKGNNKGSCIKLATYLEKENSQKADLEKSYFFSVDRDRCNKWEVVQQIDNNAKGQGLERKDDRFYSIVLSPGQTELAQIGNDPQQLKAYTRQVMETYAANFNKGVSSGDLVWYAKIEHERKHGFESPDVKTGLAQIGELKEGDQRHIHILVSRCAARENSHVLQTERTLTNADRSMHLSPMTNQRGAGRGAVKSGFDREDFYRANERSFDQMTGYQRSREESYDYCNGITSGKQHQYEQGRRLGQSVGASRNQELNQSINRSADQSIGY